MILVGTNINVDDLEKKHRKTLDINIGLQAVASLLGITIVILVNIIWIWMGIIVGSFMTLLGFTFFLDSSRYVRDIWKIEIEIKNTDDIKKVSELSQELSMKIGYRDVDRNWGMAYLTLAAGIFGLTAIMAL
jgi:hypothetical protein